MRCERLGELRKFLHTLENAVKTNAEVISRIVAGNCGAIGTGRYLPMQNFEKISRNTSSLVVTPVSASNPRSAS